MKRLLAFEFALAMALGLVWGWTQNTSAQEATTVAAAPAAAEADAEDAEKYQLPAALSDPAFDQYCDISLLGPAWKGKNAQLLADLGLQLASGEKVLMRSHKAGSAEDLLRLACSVAARNGDKETLNRINKAARGLQFEKAASATANADKLASASRKEDPALKVAVDQHDPQEILLYGDMIRDVRNAELLCDKESLDQFDKALASVTNLSDDRVNYLKRIIGEARSAQPDQAAQENTFYQTISKLEGDSRCGWGGGYGYGCGWNDWGYNRPWWWYQQQRYGQHHHRHGHHGHHGGYHGHH